MNNTIDVFEDESGRFQPEKTPQDLYHEQNKGTVIEQPGSNRRRYLKTAILVLAGFVAGYGYHIYRIGGFT